jgi:His/Glu/Gln/Arg/opine family amino acid ABC transporter permease subunit
MTFDGQVFLDALTSSNLLNGAVITIALALLAQVTAAIIGLFLALARTSPAGPLRSLSGFYIWIFRAIPTLLWLLLIWNALPQVVPALKQSWFTPFVAGYIGLALAEGAYMAEIIRSALLAVDPGQRHAAKALGMTPGRTLRRIVIPQVIRVAIPPTANELITLLKLTSLTSVISLQELLTVTQQEISTSFRFAEWYAAAAVYYLVIVSVLMVLQARVERRYQWTSQSRRRPKGALAMPVAGEAR